MKTRDAAGEEAGKVAVEFDVAGYFSEEYARPLQESLVCYSRSIIAEEWPTLADDRTLTAEPTSWANRMDEVFARLAAERNEQPYGTILTIDKERAEARRKRLTEAQPTIPDGLVALMLGIACVAIFAIGTFTLPNVSRRVQIGVLTALVVVLGALLLTIRDLDRKYSGWSIVEPSDMRITEDVVSDRFARRYPGAALPCDASGGEL